MGRPTRTRRRWIGLLPLLLLLAYLLMPLSSRTWEIDSDEADAKSDYLAGERSRARSTSDRVLPRVILIVADDLALVDVASYAARLGRAGYATPAIDRIGAEGALFTQAHATATICAPSRAALLTGRYQQRFGFELQPHTRYPRNRLEYLVFRHVIDTDPMRPIRPDSVPGREAVAAQGLPASEITLAELLGARGYRTAVYGKWHLGYDSERFSPLAFGFDEHYGFYEAFSLYAPVDDPDVVHTPVDDFSDRHMWRRGRRGASAIVHDDRVVQEDEYLTFRFSELAEDYVRDHAHEPFFLYLPFSAPHTPLQAPREYHDRFPEIEDPVVRTYTAMIAALDDAVGRVLTAVDEAGIADETMIIFTSDNGGTSYLGVTDNGPLAGGKFTTYQGGSAVPLMIRYPDAVAPGTVVETPVSLLDVFATVDRATAAGGHDPRPDSLALDGRDLMPLVARAGEADTDTTRPRAHVEHVDPEERALFWRSWYNKAVRLGDWKLVVTEAGAPGTSPGDPARLELYHLGTDPRERDDVANEHPEVIADLTRRLHAWEAGLAPPRWPPVMHFRHRIHGVMGWFAI